MSDMDDIERAAREWCGRSFNGPSEEQLHENMVQSLAALIRNEVEMAVHHAGTEHRRYKRLTDDRIAKLEKVAEVVRAYEHAFSNDDWDLSLEEHQGAIHEALSALDPPPGAGGRR